MDLNTGIYKWNGYNIKKIVEDQMALYVNQDIIEFLSSIDIKGKNVIDGGSNIGIYALLFSDLVGKKGKVYCFEIQKVINDLAVYNAKLNNKENIVNHNLALSNKSDERLGHTFIDYTGENISSVGVKSETGIGEPIETIAIDDMNLDNIGLIKLDLEGYEPKALDGMQRTIQKHKPYLIVELSPTYLNNNDKQEAERIKQMGYTLTEISDFNYLGTPI